MIGLPNYVVGSSVPAPIFLLAVGLFWLVLLVVALTLAAANGRDGDKLTARD
jgi:hypothetical protein